jgi:serine protease Do
MPSPTSDSTSVLDAVADAARTALARVGPAVVRIGRGGGRGCGVVIGDGLVATNAHNLRDRTTAVTFADGREVQAEAVGVDGDRDLAVLRVDTGDAPAVEWGGAPAAGDVVFAVARGAAGGTRVAFGLVSGTERAFRGPRGRRIAGSVEHTAPLPRGSSGSPVVTPAGTVVGLSTHRVGDGAYLALPADDGLAARLADLAAGRPPVRPRLGVGLAPASVARSLRRSVGLPDRDGLLVRVVEPGGPAATAGVTEGDLLIAVAGAPVTSVDDLHDALARAGAGARVELTVVRGADERGVAVDLPAADPDDAENTPAGEEDTAK